MKKAIVVGATSGIGKELALILAKNGYRVGITGRRTALLTEIQKQNPDAFIPKTFDVAETGTVPQHLQELVNELGGLDLLILSSGVGEANKTLDFAIEKGTLDVNVAGFTCVVDWAFVYFWKQKSGHLVNISSIAGIRGSSIAHAYNASKAFQINYLEGLRQKTNKIKVQISITDIRPGFVKTDMAKGPGQFWVAPVEKASAQIFDAIASKKRVAYVTKRWWLIAVLLKLVPRFLYDKM